MSGTSAAKKPFALIGETTLNKLMVSFYFKSSFLSFVAPNQSLSFLGRGRQGLIWVVDSADRQRLEDCRAELHKLLQEEKLAGASLLVFANKQDLRGALSHTEIHKLLNLDDIGNRHWHIQRCSAVTGEGLSDGISWLVNDISSRIFLLD
jgi:signal recognition particle receptor subunit beta